MRFKFFIIAIFLFLNVSCCFCQTGAEIYDKNINSIVTITTDKGTGTGFFIDSNLIVTNYHVMKDVSITSAKINSLNIRMTLEGYVAIDKIRDIIILKTSYASGISVKLSSLNINQGNKVYIIGSSLGDLTGSISEGVVSGLRDYGNDKFIQISAPISPGNSGGPVFDEKGEVMGVATSSRVDNGAQNINFAIPITEVENLLIFKTKYVTHFDGSIADSTAIQVFKKNIITLLNGNEIEIKSYTQDDIYISYTKTGDRPKKTRIIEKYDVFSIKKEDGSEEVIFKGDSLTFTIAEARNYIRGEQAARQFYHKPFNKWAAGIFGAGTSLLSFYSLPVPMLYGVVIGRFDPKKMQIPTGYDAPFSSTEEYRLGYNKKARNMKIQESLKWGYIGLGVGLASFIIYGISAH